MYWIEVDYLSGKKLRREYKSLNDSFAVYKRYTGTRKNKVSAIRAGKDDTQTLEHYYER